MSRAPRHRAVLASHDGDWSEVRTAADTHGLIYRVLWSAESWMYLGLCDSYPNLSWRAANDADALDGIRAQVQRLKTTAELEGGEVRPPTGANC
ncbi:hypothetical protein EB72_08430 [Mycobacterium sp. SWH-M1]|nr:hypothetical protein EB72_08430 [Mycobacterium sp. SWH-M1]